MTHVKTLAGRIDRIAFVTYGSHAVFSALEVPDHVCKKEHLDRSFPDQSDLALGDVLSAVYGRGRDLDIHRPHGARSPRIAFWPGVDALVAYVVGRAFGHRFPVPLRYDVLFTSIRGPYLPSPQVRAGHHR